ncbi:Ser-Thr-rich glycosyl-phosphatidyl-inositol-anchored membrane family-domain-containing protein, partial [Phaeosphaeriaceae sp. PMI808]
MRFFEILVSGAALVSTAFAVEINDYPSGGVVAGQTYTITYSPKDQTPTTFVLRRGDSSRLDTVATLGTATGGTFTWTVPKDLPNAATYAFEVRQDGQVPNYSPQFPLTGGSGSLSSVLASTSSAISSARSAASSAASSASAAISSSAASASITPSAGTNSTIVSATLSRTTSVSVSRATGAPTGSSTPPQSTGAAAALGSNPLALVFGAVAAFAYL